ncbi:MAG: beta-propeller fold lactonase family protein [Bacteroidales bacterium]|jgi:YVTN family beta-propeller protein
MKKLLFILSFANLTVIANAQTAYITNSYSNSVTAIDVATDTIKATIPVGTYPFGVSVSRDGSKVYVTNWTANTVNVINTATNTVTDTITVGNGPVGISVSPDGHKVYVANQHENTVSIINTAADTVMATIYVGSQPYGISVSPDGHRVYVANSADNTVSVINSAVDTVMAVITGVSNPTGVAVTPDGSKVYIANWNNSSVSVINTTSETVIKSITVGVKPQGISVNPDGSKVYVSNWNDNTINIINCAADTVSSTIAVGAVPIGVSATPDGSKIYVVNEFANTVYKINGTNNAVIDTITVGSYPISFGDFISIYPNPLVHISASADNICAGISTTLTASGATSYSWNNGLGTANPVPVTPSVTTTYIVTGTTTGGSATASITITVNPLPVVNAGNDTTICQGSSATLHASGGIAYSWSPAASLSSSSAANPMATPMTTTDYHVTVTNGNGCSSTGSVTVHVDILNIAASANPDSICAGDCSTLTVSGGVYYIWSDAETTNQIVVCPTTTTWYTVTVESALGCSGTVSFIVTVNVCTGISEKNSANNIAIYPNPATDNLTIETPQKAIIEISNIQGQLIKTLATSGNKTNIDVSALPGGMYIVEVKTEKGVMVNKFIKE